MSNNKILTAHYARSDKIMLGIIAGLFIYALVLASWMGTWAEAIIVGGGTLAAMATLVHLAAGQTLTRAAIGAALMVMTALHIHQSHGMIEFHFGVFLLLAILLFYRDWVPVLAAAVTIAVHHVLFFFLQKSGSAVWVLGDDNLGFNIILLHAAYVVVETAIVIFMCKELKGEAVQSAELMDIISHAVQDDKIVLSGRTSGSTELLQQYNSYADDIESLVTEVHHISQQLENNGSTLKKVINDIQDCSKKQFTETDLVATAAEEMTAAITEVSSNADETAKSTLEVSSHAQDCSNANKQTSLSIEKMSAVIIEAIATMKRLNSNTEAISKVIDVIRGIAEQTNLLALNAAIEAARAGEQGRGFAVVADEVRSLAQRTQEATTEINNMITALQQESQSAVDVIQQSQEHVDNCMKNTANSLELVTQVNEAISTINSMSALIATSATEQSNVTHEISRNISTIVDTSQDIINQSNVAAEAGDDLHKFSASLLTLSQRFVSSR